MIKEHLSTPIIQRGFSPNKKLVEYFNSRNVFEVFHAKIVAYTTGIH